MGAIKTAADSVYRDFATDGVPGSGPNNPAKAAIRSLFGMIDDDIVLAQSSVAQPVESAGAASPPVSPATGQRWIVASPATGLWAGRENYLATWDGSAWSLLAPPVGYVAVVTDARALYYWNGAAWIDITAASAVYATLADLTASTSHAPVNGAAFVTSDPTSANNGLYKNTGTAAAPVWTYVSALKGDTGAAGAAWSYLPAAGGSVKAANAAALPSYAYSSGVMTASANGAFPTLDGVALSVGDRFFHWDWTGANGANIAYGIYTLTNAGSVSTKWTATRATDADSAAKLGLISAFVVGGAVNAGRTLAVTQAAGAITLGTTAIIVAVVAGVITGQPAAVLSSVTASGTTSTLYTATAPATFTTMFDGAMTILSPPSDNLGNVTITMTPPGGSAIGPKPVYTRAGAQIPAGFMKSGVYYLLIAQGTTAWRAIALDSAPMGSQLSIVRSGSIVCYAASTANGEISIYSTNSAGSVVEMARIDKTSGNLRVLNGKLCYGATAGAAVFPFDPSNRQPYVDAYSDYTTSARQQRSAVVQTLEDIDPVIIANTTPWYVSAGDNLRVIRVSAAGYVDCRHLPRGGRFRFVVDDVGGCGLNLFADANWRGAGGTNLVYGQGADVEVVRMGNADYVARTLYGSAPTVNSAARPVAAKTVAVLGQSNAATIMLRGGLAGIRDSLAAQSIMDDINFLDCASGGSALIKGNESLVNNYWWDTSGGGSAGPLATAAIATINASIAAGQPAPSLVIWRQGEQDGTAIASAGLTTPATVQSALESLIAYIRSQLSLPNLKFLICPLGANDSAAWERGYTAMRESHLRVGAETNCYVGPDMVDLPRTESNIHLSFYGAYIDGKRLGLHIGNILYSKTNFLGPYVSGVSISGTTATVTVVPDPASSSLANANNPIPVDGFAFASNANAVDATIMVPTACTRSFSAGVHTFTFTLPSDGTGYQLVWPYGALAQAARSGRIIKSLLTDLPLRSFNRNFT